MSLSATFNLAVGNLVKNIDQWVDNNIGGIPFVGGAIASIVKWVLHFLFQIISDVADVVLFVIALGIDAVQLFANMIWQTVQAIGGTLASLGDWVYNHLWPYITAAFDDVRHFIAGLVDAAVSGLTQLAHDLVSAVSAALDWTITNVLDPVWQWVARSADIVGGWIADGLAAFYRDVLMPVFSFLESGVELAATLWDWFTTAARDAVSLVGKASSWLLWFATHPFDFFRALAGDAGSRPAHWVGEWIASWFHDNAGALDGMLSRFVDRL